MMKKILVVDDEPAIRDVLKKALERHNDCLVETAQDGQEALDAIDRQKNAPDLILLDLVMPNISGEQLLRIIKNHYKTAHVPVIISTVRRETSTILDLMRAGAVDYLMKPYDIQDLISLVRKYT